MEGTSDDDRNHVAERKNKARRGVEGGGRREAAAAAAASTLPMSEAEIDLICRLHWLLGDRWDLISGRLPGRSAEEVERCWEWLEERRMVCRRRPTKQAKLFKPKCVRLGPSNFRFVQPQELGDEATHPKP